MGKRKWTDEELMDASAKAKTMSEIMRALKLRKSGDSFILIKKHMTRLNLKVPPNTPPNFTPREINSLESYLVENSQASTKEIKRKLLQQNRLEKKCQICQINSWLNKPLVLHLDHINGVPTDCRIENLRLLCPNCHSQTDTYCGRASKIKHRCPKCSAQISKRSQSCQKCFNRQLHEESYRRRTKILWPPVEEVQKLVWEKPTRQLALELSVSDSAIGKFCKVHDIQKPPRGYWAKINAGISLEGIEPSSQN